MTNAPIVVGKISGVYGVKGWVKVFSHAQPRENILQYSPWLVKQNKQWQPLKLINGRPQSKTIVAQLEGVSDRDQAHALIGCEIAIEPSQLKQLENDDFYWRDLEGLTVVDVAGKTLGKVSHLIETGANDVMVVRKEPSLPGKEKEMMIPYLYQQVVKSVDLEQGQITVDWDDDY